MKKSKNSSSTYVMYNYSRHLKEQKKACILWSLLSMGRQIIMSVLNNDETRVDVCVCVYI